MKKKTAPKAEPTTNSNEVVTIRGRVTRIFKNGPSFSAGLVRLSNGKFSQFRGNFFVMEDEIVAWQGIWTQHAKFGKQFTIMDPIYETTLDVEGLSHYLANNPKMKGIGPVKAQKIAATFGQDFDRIINEEPEAVSRLVGLSPQLMAVIRDEWNARRDMNSALTLLSKYGLTHNQVKRLTNKFGKDSVKILGANPYMLLGEVEDFGFKRVDEIALKTGLPKNNENRLRAGIIYCVQEKLDEGDCWIELPELVDLANRALILDNLDSKAVIERMIRELIADKRLACINIDDRSLIALPHIYKVEHCLADWLSEGHRDNPHFRTIPNIDEMIAKKFSTHNDKQREAMAFALKYRQVLISGPAGSGKTYLSKAICDFYESKGLKIVLAAPTGKAARRLTESTGREAKTIHRLIGYNGFKFTRQEDEPIDADAVILDETSMIDVQLMYELFRAVNRNRTCLIFLGDHHQLAPVGAGNVLRDLIDRRPVPTVILTEVVRQAGVLRENSFKVLNGMVAETEKISGVSPWYLQKVRDKEGKPSAEVAKEAIIELYESYLSERMGFNIIHDVQLLIPQKSGTIGVEAMNIALQAAIQKKLYGVDVEPVPSGKKPKLYVHDKVIQTKRNNYELDVMNGEMGVVVDTNNGAVTVSFGDRTVPFSQADARNLELAYALTIHKFQGSQVPCAIVVIHKAHSFMLDRSLFYTGVTRAQKTAITIGDPWGIKHCIEQQRSIARKTFLSILPLKRAT